MLQGAQQLYRFADFTLDIREHRLLRGSVELYLQPRTFETLCYLVQRHGHLVKKQELLDALWADTAVTENALSRCIKEVRDVLQDDAHQPLYIRTIPRVGYKFIADVEDVHTASSREEPPGILIDRAGDSTSDAAQISPSAVGHRSKKVIVTSVGLVAILAAGLSIYYLSSRHTSASLQIKSIAVLPFKPLVAESHDEALEMGMADTLITKLGNLSQLTVRPISAVRKYTALDQDVLEAGREQRVDAVLEGSIQKTSDEIRVTVRLLRIVDGTQLWSEQFNEKSSNLFSIQDSISERVTRTVELKVTGEQRELLTKRYTTDADAYALYLKGRYFLNRSSENDFRRSVGYFEQALQRDPNYSLAYAGLADSYAQLGSFGLVEMKESFEHARAAAANALQREPGLSEAHASLGYVLMNYYWDWVEAEKEFQQAIALNANYAMAHNWYAQYLAFMGRFEEAIKESRRAREIDPLSPWNNSGFVLFLARQYDNAIEESHKTLELDSSFAVAHMIIGLSYIKKEAYEQGFHELESAKENPDSRALLGYAYAMAGRDSEARKIAEELKQLSSRKYVAAFPLAALYAGLDEKDLAFKYLEKAYEQRSWAMGMLKVNPVFDSLRSDPRFDELLRRLNLPTAAK